jgi:hypothetical protein
MSQVANLSLKLTSYKAFHWYYRIIWKKYTKCGFLNSKFDLLIIHCKLPRCFNDEIVHRRTF